MDIKRPDLKRKKFHRQVLYGGVILAALIAGGVALSALEPVAPKVARNNLWTGTVQWGDFALSVPANGQLVAGNLWSVDTAVGGRVERVLVKPGAQVDKDTVLVELSNPGLIQQMHEAEWALEASLADLNALEAKLERDETIADAETKMVEIELNGLLSDVETDRELAERGVISRRQYRITKEKSEQLIVQLESLKQRAKALRKSNRALLNAQAARNEQAKRLLQRYQEQVKGLRLTAGINGELTEVNVQEGQQLVLGANVARVAKMDELIAELAVGEFQIRDVQLGQTVIVDTRKGEISGEIIRIDPKVSNGYVTVEVRFTENLPEGSRLDTSIEGKIVTDIVNDALYVDRPAFAAPFAVTSVFRIDNKNSAHRVPVKFGRISADYAEILPDGATDGSSVLEDGIREGDVIILSDDSGDWREVQRLQLN